MEVWSYDSGSVWALTLLPGGILRVEDVREMGLDEARRLGAVMEHDTAYPSRRLLRAVRERDIGRIRGLGGAWLSRLLWRDSLAAAAAGRADGADTGENRVLAGFGYNWGHGTSRFSACSTGASVAGLTSAAAFSHLRRLSRLTSSSGARWRRTGFRSRGEKARRELERLQNSRAVVEVPIAPRERIYGPDYHGGDARLYHGRPHSVVGDRPAQNSHLFMLSDVPITRFRSVIFREVYLGDFTGLDGADDDSQILKYVVPWSAGPPVLIGPQPAGADPRLAAGLTDSRYEYAGSMDADDLGNLADATLYAYLGTEDASKVQLPPCIFAGDGAGRLLDDREVLDSDGNRTGGFFSLGCAWANARTYQTNPETGQGIGSVSGTRGFVWEVEGAGMRDWRGAATGREIFAAVIPRTEPAAGVTSSAARLAVFEDESLFAAKDISGFHVLGVVGAAPSVSGRINQNVFILGSDGAKTVRDNLLAAANVAVVDEPAAGADEELVGGASGVSAQADGATATSVPLPSGRDARDYIGLRFVFEKGEESVSRFYNAFVVQDSGGASLGFAGGKINISVNVAGTSVTWDYVNSDDSAATDAQVMLTLCVGVAPLDDRAGSALDAWKAFISSADNVAAVKQLNLVCAENTTYSFVAATEYGRFRWGRYVAASDYSDAGEVSESLWLALPRTYSANPVVSFMDWIMSPARPSGFQVDADAQLARLPELTREANECDRLIDIGNFVLQMDSSVKDSDGNFEKASSYDYVGKAEREVDPEQHRFVTIAADGEETTIAGSEFGPTFSGVVQTGASQSGEGMFTHNGLVYNFRWRVVIEHAGEEDHGFLNLFTRDTFRPRWAIEVDRFNSDIVLRGDGGRLIQATPSSLEIPEEAANPLAAAFCTVPVVFMAVTKADGTVSRVSRRLAEVQFAYAVSEYKWEIPEGTLTIAVTRLASGRLGTTMTVTPASGITSVVVTSAHLEVCMRKFEFNDRVSAGESERRNLERFAESAAGDVWDEGLSLRFRVARWSPVVATLRTRDFAAELEVSREEDGEAHDTFTGMKAVFRDLSNNWLEAETMTVEDEISRARNGGFESRLDVVMPSANSRWRATTMVNQMLILERARRTVQLRPVRFGFGFLERGDRVMLDMAEYGFDNAVFQVRQVRTERNGLTLFLREDREEWYSDALFQAGDGSCGLFCGVGLTDDAGEALTDDSGAALVD